MSMTNPSTNLAAAADDLQAHLEVLEKRGLLRTIHLPVDKDTELHPLVRWQFRGLEEVERTAFLFDSVVDSRGRHYAIPVVVGALAGSQEIYEMSIGFPQNEIERAWKSALTNPVAPQLVTDAPVQEVVHQGDALLEHDGLDEFPVPISTPGFDNAPYFNSGILVTRDPETGIGNAGVYRMQLKSPTRLGVFCSSENDAAHIWERYNARGEPMPVAVVVGAPPAVYLAAIQLAPADKDELALAGALMGKPLPVVNAKTVPLSVPANAQVVIEGYIRTDFLEPEGSFGEAHGYLDPRSLSFALEITAITHRREPIWLSIISQLTPSESSKTKQAGYEAQLLKRLRDDCGLSGVVDVALCEELLNRQFAVVVLKKRNAYEPMNALYALQATRQTPKLAVAVDDDIDPRNPLMVIWAIVNRSQPHRDLKVLTPRELQFGPLRIAQHLEGYDGFDSYVLIDATAKAPLPPVALPAQKFMEQARQRWEELGLPPLTPRTPWHGYSLGLWSEENAEEAILATEGRYYETGAKLIDRAVPVERGTKLAEINRHDLA